MFGFCTYLRLWVRYWADVPAETALNASAAASPERCAKSMKTPITILTILIWNTCFSQTDLLGEYKRQDSKIWLNSDTTFKFFYSVDTYRGWAKGTWRIEGRRILLTPIPIYDTLSLADTNGITRDSLVLSKDEISTRIVNDGRRTISVFQFEQDFKLCPTTLLYKSDKLFILKNGKRQTKKINNGYYIAAFDPWYTKTKAIN